MEIPNKYLICDIRTPKEFENGTISGYKKKDVINAYQNALINTKVEEAIHWAVELHISTYNKEIWKSLFEVYFKYIHMNNPKLFFYLIQRKKEYDNIIIFYPKNHYIFCRNNQEIRNMFCDVTSICVLSKKNNMFLDKSLPKVNLNKLSKEELIKRRILDSYEIVHDMGYDDLNKTEILCLNQMFTNLNNHQGTLNNCFYWYILLEKSMKEKAKDNKKKQEVYLKYESAPNSMLNYVDKNKIPSNKHWTNLIWEMFDRIILNNDKNNKLLKKLKEYYYEDFKESKITSLKYLIFLAFIILKTNQIKWTKNLISQYDLYIQLNGSINFVYFEISNKILNKFDQFSKDMYIKQFYELQNKLLNKTSKEPKIINKDINNIHLNKILRGNPLKQDDFTENDEIQDKTKLINKNKTKKDELEAKEEKIDKKLNYFNQFLTKKGSREKPKVLNQEVEIKELIYKKKTRS